MQAKHIAGVVGFGGYYSKARGVGKSGKKGDEGFVVPKDAWRGGCACYQAAKKAARLC